MVLAIIIIAEIPMGAQKPGATPQIETNAGNIAMFRFAQIVQALQRFRIRLIHSVVSI